MPADYTAVLSNSAEGVFIALGLMGAALIWRTRSPGLAWALLLLLGGYVAVMETGREARLDRLLRLHQESLRESAATQTACGEDLEAVRREVLGMHGHLQDATEALTHQRRR